MVCSKGQKIILGKEPAHKKITTDRIYRMIDMFIAIPKCISLTDWKQCLIAKSKGQAKRLIIQYGYEPEQFDIVETKDIQ